MFVRAGPMVTLFGEYTSSVYVFNDIVFSKHCGLWIADCGLRTAKRKVAEE